MGRTCVRWHAILAACLLHASLAAQEPASDDGSVENLLAALRNGDPARRAAAAATLGTCRPQADLVVPALSAALKDTAIPVCIAAARALGDLGPAAGTASAALLDALDSADNPLREAVSSTLHRLLYDSLSPPASVLAGLRDARPRVRAGVVRALREPPRPNPEVYAALIERMDDPSAEVRREAARALGCVWKPPEALIPLAEALSDADVEVRRNAGYALSQFGTYARPIADRLCRALVGADGRVDAHVATTLGNLGPETEGVAAALVAALGRPGEQENEPLLAAVARMGAAGRGAVPHLLPLLGSTRTRLRLMAAQTLCAVAPDSPEVVVAVTEVYVSLPPYEANELAGRLARLGEAAAAAGPALVRALADPARREGAMNVLSILRPPPVEALRPLVELFLHGDARAAEAIRAFGSTALAALSPGLDHENVEVRKGTIDCLGSMLASEPRAAITLARALDDPYRAASLRARDALERAGAGLIPVLGDTLRNDDVSEQVLAIQVLDLLRRSHPQANLLLVDALSSPSRVVRALGAATLGRDPHPAGEVSQRILELSNRLESSVRWLLSPPSGREQIPQGAMQELAELVTDENPELRVVGLIGLARMEDRARSTLPRFVAALADPAAVVRRTAAREVARLGDRSEVLTASLAAALRDPAPPVRECAIAALGRIAPDILIAAPALIDLVESEKDPLIRGAASSLLPRIGPAVLPQLIEAIRDPKRQGCLGLALCLFEVKPSDPTLLPAILSLFRDSRAQVRLAAVGGANHAGVVAEGEPWLGALVERLDDEDEYVRREAVNALHPAKKLDTRAILALTPSLKHAEVTVRSRAVSLLGKADVIDEKVVRSAARALEDRSEEVRTAAIQALRELGPKAADALPALIQALRGSEPSIRSDVAELLGSWRAVARPALPALERAVDDPDPRVRDAVSRAIAAIRGG